MNVLEIKGGELLRDTDRDDREENDCQQSKEAGVRDGTDEMDRCLLRLGHGWTSGKAHHKSRCHEESSGVPKDDG